MKMKAFACPSAELTSRLPGWQKKRPRRMQPGINPFTNAPMLMPVQDEPEFPPDALSSFADVPGREVSWTPRTVATLAAFFDRSAQDVTSSPRLVGPNGMSVTDLDRSVLSSLAKIDEPLPDFAERVSRYGSDRAHADEHGEAMRLTPDEHVELPIETIRARFHLPDIDPHYTEQHQRRLDTWRTWLEELLAFAPSVEPGTSAYCVVWHETR